MSGVHRNFYTLWVLLLASLHICTVSAKTYVRLEAEEEACFYEELKHDDPLYVTFEVVEGGYLDIDVRILSPSNEELFFKERQTDGEEKLVAKSAGRYTVCFANKMSTLTAKLVRFGIHPRHGELLLKEMEMVKTHQLVPVQEQVERLADQILQLSEKEQLLHTRSERQQEIVESTHWRSLLTSLFEAFMLVMINAWQIYYLRCFFEVKRVL